MDEEQETYKGHRVAVRSRSAARASGHDQPPGEPELTIDGEPVFTVKDSAGLYVAGTFAYDPQPSLLALGKRIVDYRSATRREA